MSSRSLARAPTSAAFAAMTPVSTFMGEKVDGMHRYRHTLAVSSNHDGGDRAPGTHFAFPQLDGHVHHVPVVLPLFLYRAFARAAVSAREQGHPRAPGAPAPDVAPAR